jgi:hypothetical protein
MDTTTTTQHEAPPAGEDAQPADEHRAPVPIAAEKTPQEFYAAITIRADVRAILNELSTG